MTGFTFYPLDVRRYLNVLAKTRSGRSRAKKLEKRRKDISVLSLFLSLTIQFVLSYIVVLMLLFYILKKILFIQIVEKTKDSSVNLIKILMKLINICCSRVLKLAIFFEIPRIILGHIVVSIIALELFFREILYNIKS